MARRGRKLSYGRTRDAAVLFYALRGSIGYRPAMRDVEALFAVAPRNIERELSEREVVSESFREVNALCALAANERFIKAQLRSGASAGIDKWPELLRQAIEQFLPGASAR